MRVVLTEPDHRAVMRGTEEELGHVHSAAIRELTVLLQDGLRDGVIRAGLGVRLARTWRSKAYPQGGSSLDAAGFVWSKAPKLIEAYNAGAVILPTDGRRYVAIPTQNVPLKGRGRRMTPLEVEVRFNQDLIIKPGRAGRKLAFVNAIASRAAGRWRPVTRGRAAQGRKTQLVLMFVLAPSVRIAKRLDDAATVERISARLPELISKHWR